MKTINILTVITALLLAMPKSYAQDQKPDFENRVFYTKKYGKVVVPSVKKANEDYTEYGCVNSCIVEEATGGVVFGNGVTKGFSIDNDKEIYISNIYSVSEDFLFLAKYNDKKKNEMGYYAFFDENFKMTKIKGKDLLGAGTFGSEKPVTKNGFFVLVENLMNKETRVNYVYNYQGKLLKKIKGKISVEEVGKNALKITDASFKRLALIDINGKEISETEIEK